MSAINTAALQPTLPGPALVIGWLEPVTSAAAPPMQPAARALWDHDCDPLYVFVLGMEFRSKVFRGAFWQGGVRASLSLQTHWLQQWVDSDIADFGRLTEVAARRDAACLIAKNAQCHTGYHDALHRNAALAGQVLQLAATEPRGAT